MTADFINLLSIENKMTPHLVTIVLGTFGLISALIVYAYKSDIKNTNEKLEQIAKDIALKAAIDKVDSLDRRVDVVVADVKEVVENYLTRFADVIHRADDNRTEVINAISALGEQMVRKIDDNTILLEAHKEEVKTEFREQRKEAGNLRSYINTKFDNIYKDVSEIKTNSAILFTEHKLLHPQKKEIQ